MSFLCPDIDCLIDGSNMSQSRDKKKYFGIFLSRFIIFFCNVLIKRGKILREILDKRQVNITKLAEKLPWSVKTVYRHFDDDHLSYEKVAEYARAINYDFTEEFPDLAKFNFKALEEIPIYKNSNDVEYYRTKYEQLLERYNYMMEKYTDLIGKYYDRDTAVVPYPTHED